MATRTHALVIDEEYLIALEIQQVLQDAGVGDVEIYGSVADAEAHWKNLSPAAGIAVVDGRMGAKTVVDFTTRLAHSGASVVVTSADRELSAEFPHAKFVGKPFDTKELVAAVTAAAQVS